jgi:hypothetical protein
MKLNINKIYAMKFDEIITNLKTMLPAADFIMTGSYVLAEYGLMPWDKVYDLDIILVKPQLSAIVLLNNYMKDHPAPSTSKLKTTVLPFPENESHKDGSKIYKDEKATTVKTLQAIFMFGDTKIDVFIENDFNEPVLVVNGNKYTTVPHILQAKKSYGRMKD